MRSIKRKIEGHFARLGHFTYRRRRIVLLLSFLLIGGLVSRIGQIVFDNSPEVFLREGDVSRRQYNDFLEQFGRDEIVAIAVKAPDLFAPDFIGTLKSFHEALAREIPYVSRVRSLINARHTWSEGDTLHVEDLLGEWPEKEYDLEAVRRLVMGNELYRNNLISGDGRYTAVIIETTALLTGHGDADGGLLDGFDSGSMETPSQTPKRRYFSDREAKEVVDAVFEVAGRYEGPDFELVYSGGPVIMDGFNKAMAKDMRSGIILSTLAITFFLVLLFRRISGVALPIVIILSAAMSTLGLMGLLGAPMTMSTVMIPSFLVAVGVASSVHILAIFYRRLDSGDSREDAVAYALGHSGLAVLLASLTTAAGLLSFSMAELLTIADMGRFAAAGVMLAFVYTVVMLPAMIGVFPIKPRASHLDRPPVMDRILLGCGRFAAAHSGKIILTSLAVFGFSVFFMFNLRFSNYFIDWFAEDMKTRQDVEFYDREFNGSTNLEVIVDTGAPYGIYDPDLLDRIETFTRRAEAYRKGDMYVGKVFSINDVIKEIHKALNDDDPDMDPLPADRQTIAQELLLFENSGSDDLERLVDSEYRKTRMTIRTPTQDAVVFETFIEDMQDLFEDAFQGKAEITLTGMMVLYARTVPAALRSMTHSYVIAFVVITLMIIMLVGELRLGLLSMIPNLLPIFMIMGLMGFLDQPLDMGTLMIGSIVMGLVVDDALHFIYNFQRYYDQTGDVRYSINTTFTGTGRALLVTTLVLAASFFSGTLYSELSCVIRFGVFVGIAIVFALLVDFLLLPALLVRVVRDRVVGDPV